MKFVKLVRPQIEMVLFLALLCLFSLNPIVLGIQLPGVCSKQRGTHFYLKDLPQCQVLLIVPHYSILVSSPLFGQTSRNSGPCYQLSFDNRGIQLFHSNSNITNDNTSYVNVEITRTSAIFEGVSTVRTGANHDNPCFKKQQETITIWAHENVFILWNCENINYKFRDEVMIVALHRTKYEKVDFNRVKDIVRNFTGDDLADLLNWPNEGALDQICEDDKDFLKCPPTKQKKMSTNPFPVFMIVTLILIGVIVIITLIKEFLKKMYHGNRIYYLQ